MKLSRLKHLYIEELRDLYSAENQLVKALPKMAKAATCVELRAGFTKHLDQTIAHVARLEEIFNALGERPKGKRCKGMEGLIQEGDALIVKISASEELDAGLISAAQHVEHYEIAGYGCVSTYAKLLGDHRAVSLLRQTLVDEKETDENLSQLEGSINLEAADSGESASGGSLPRTATVMKAKAARA